MGLHRYDGNKQHSFRERYEECIWCKGYTTKGYMITFLPKNSNGSHFIETDFCSPKCYHESIEKGFREKDYFEKFVGRFIDFGGIEEHKKQIEKEKENQKIRILEREKEREKQKMIKIIYYATIIVSVVTGYYLLFILEV